jgi:hypothetical protein
MCAISSCVVTNRSTQAAQLAANDIAAIPSRIKPPPLDAAAAPDVSLQSDVDWSKFTVTSERIAYRRFLQVITCLVFCVSFKPSSVYS